MKYTLGKTLKGKTIEISAAAHYRLNTNWAIFGYSGSGKSFTIKKMILNELKNNNSKIIIVDPMGRDYLGLHNVLGSDSEYIRIDPLNYHDCSIDISKKITIFDVEKINTNDNCLDYILTIINNMIKNSKSTAKSFIVVLDSTYYLFGLEKTQDSVLNLFRISGRIKLKIVITFFEPIASTEKDNVFLSEIIENTRYKLLFSFCQDNNCLIKASIQEYQIAYSNGRGTSIFLDGEKREILKIDARKEYELLRKIDNHLSI